MPQIQLRLHATLRKYIDGQHTVTVDIQPGQTVGELLTAQKIPSEQAKLIFVDCRAARLDTPLQGGEEVGVFPPIGGG